jgi:hypothetical protein
MEKIQGGSGYWNRTMESEVRIYGTGSQYMKKVF